MDLLNENSNQSIDNSTRKKDISNTELLTKNNNPLNWPNDLFRDRISDRAEENKRNDTSQTLYKATPNTNKDTSNSNTIVERLRDMEFVLAEETREPSKEHNNIQQEPTNNKQINKSII